MVLKQYYLGCLAHASYLVADERTKIAAVVDPQRDVEQYLRDAKDGGYTIRYVVLTHFHADFLAGHIELRNQVGARIVMGTQAQAEFDFQAVKSDDVIELGDVRIQILDTPGHTPEGISLLVFDRTKSDTIPHAVLTGDTLFIGDVGRPDLLASIGVTADELAEMLYHSLDKQVRAARPEGRSQGVAQGCSRRWRTRGDRNSDSCRTGTAKDSKPISTRYGTRFCRDSAGRVRVPR